MFFFLNYHKQLFITAINNDSFNQNKKRIKHKSRYYINIDFKNIIISKPKFQEIYVI